MAIEYTLSLPRPHTHLFRVEIRIRAASGPVELVMPSWTPGSYLLREFPRNVQDFEAHDASGRLAHRKTDKNTWRVEGEVKGGLTVRYVVYANELTVRTSHLDGTHGSVNGASVFMFVRGMEHEPVRLRVEAPEGWRVATSLFEGEDGAYECAGYDELVDSPLEIGTHSIIAWEHEGIPHRFAIWGRVEVDEERLIADTRRIIGVCAKLFGGLPYDRFLFIVHVAADGRGGLEHRNSFMLQVAPSWFSGADYEKLLVLIAHEFFHVWLGKRIRPEPLGPFDYTKENYTRNLWVVEGFTTYYAELIALRAGLMTRERFLARLGDSIARLEAVPGRRHHTLEEASFDAWIKFYRPDAHSVNSQVSYYSKGAIVAAAIDLEIRRASGGLRSLDDVMRLLWRRYGEPDQGFPEDRATGIQAVLEEVHGGSLDELLGSYVAGTDEIDFDRHLDAAGLELSGEGTERRASEEIVTPGVHEARFGMRLRGNDAGRVRVAHVLEGTPAYDAGMNADDEIVTVDGIQANAGVIEDAARRGAPGTEVELLVLRRGVGVRVALKLGPVEPRRAAIIASATADEGQLRVREGWLGAE